jgi:hypothetical protein
MANSLHNKLVDLKSIEKINEGLLVLKHFLMVNKELLPIYFNLYSDKSNGKENNLSIIKIEQLFSSFNFDVNTSKILMDSSILDDIHNAYHSIQNEDFTLEKKQDSLLHFFEEYKRLKKNWENVQLN